MVRTMILHGTTVPWNLALLSCYSSCSMAQQVHVATCVIARLLLIILQLDYKTSYCIPIGVMHHDWKWWMNDGQQKTTITTAKMMPFTPRTTKAWTNLTCEAIYPTNCSYLHFWISRIHVAFFIFPLWLLLLSCCCCCLNKSPSAAVVALYSS